MKKEKEGSPISLDSNEEKQEGPLVFRPKRRKRKRKEEKREVTDNN